MNKRRLLKLANHLLKGELGHEDFYFGAYNSGEYGEKGCGTRGCAIGECPIIFPRDWVFAKEYNVYSPVLKSVAKDIMAISQPEIRSGMEWFDLTRREYDSLFLPIEGGGKLSTNASREAVANSIIDFVNSKSKTNI